MTIGTLCTALLAVYGHSARVSDATARRVCLEVAHVAEAHGVPAALAVALAWRESRLHPAAVSPAGAVGPLQAMPATVRRLGGPWRDPVLAGVRELARLLERYDPIRALCHYGAGPRCGPRGMARAFALVRMAEALERAARSWAIDRLPCGRPSGRPPAPLKREVDP